MNELSKLLVALMMAFILMMPKNSVAQTSTVVFSDDFDSGAGCGTLSPNWTTDDATRAGINTDTANSGNCSLFTRHGVVTVTSSTVDLSGASFATLEAWVRKGDDSFSENPDTNEDLVLEYRDAGGTWIALQTFSATAIANGGITTVTTTLPVAALHAAFQMRWRQTGGSGSDFDYWHVDDVVLTENTGLPPAPTVLNANGCEDFENGFGNFTTTDTTRSGIGSQTANSPGNSLFLRHNTVTVTSIAINTPTLNEITIWVRRGSDSFSENPEGAENLVLEYFNSSGNWIALETFTGAGTQGQIFNRTYTATADMRHANFRFRITQTSGSGSDFDYWHVDDLCFSSAPPNIGVDKTSVIVSDPVNGTTNPKALPGAIIRYTLTVENTGLGVPDGGSVVVTDELPADTTMFVGNLGGGGSPFIFTDGTGSDATSLSIDFASLGSASDGVIFLDASSSNITPVIDFDGAVRSFAIRMTGTMNGTTGGGTPAFTIQYDVRLN